jgi:hypothetical protein
VLGAKRTTDSLEEVNIRKCDTAGSEITIILRYDDYSFISSTDIELRLIDDLHKLNISCLFGVIL